VGPPREALGVHPRTRRPGRMSPTRAMPTRVARLGAWTEPLMEVTARPVPTALRVARPTASWAKCRPTAMRWRVQHARMARRLTFHHHTAEEPSAPVLTCPRRLAPMLAAGHRLRGEPAAMPAQAPLRRHPPPESVRGRSLPTGMRRTGSAHGRRRVGGAHAGLGRLPDPGRPGLPDRVMPRSPACDRGPPHPRLLSYMTGRHLPSDRPIAEGQ
jgi:hypothetical protein